MNRALIPTLLFLCVSCSPERHPVEIPFEVRLNGERIACGTDAGTFQLMDLRFYVHNVRLVASDGKQQPVALEPDDTWQGQGVALIDLEDGQGACLNGSLEMNVSVRGTIGEPAGEGLKFDIGVPESLNHADPMIAPSPLGYTEMHWHWASGYKFLRAGIATDNDSFFLHLGSSRCEGTIGDIKGCRSANRPHVSLDGFRPGRDRVVIDLGALTADIDLADGERSECMSGPSNTGCSGPFSRLGIDFESGESVESAHIFSAESGR